MVRCYNCMTVFMIVGLLLLVPAFPASAAEPISDIWIESQLTTTFALNEHLNPFNLKVDAENGKVTLSGTVDSDIDKSLAHEIARGTSGVESVDNNIRVEPSAGDSKSSLSGFAEGVGNATTSAKVKSNLLWNKNISGMDISVSTDNGVVTLSGTVASVAERDLALKVAENTSGVREVIDRLKVASGTKKKNLSQEADGAWGNAGETMNEAMAETGRVVSDTWITTKVKSRLMFDKHVDGLGISVSTLEGVVTLEGTVDSDARRDYVTTLVENMVNVRDVVNRLKVKA